MNEAKYIGMTAQELTLFPRVGVGAMSLRQTSSERLFFRQPVFEPDLAGRWIDVFLRVFTAF